MHATENTTHETAKNITAKPNIPFFSFISPVLSTFFCSIKRRLQNFPGESGGIVYGYVVGFYLDIRQRFGFHHTAAF